MPLYLTPGVRFEALDRGAPPIEPFRTDIAAFIGVAQRGPLHKPLRVESFEQFRSAFGDLIENALMPFAIKAFFENGGRTCYAVRVAAPVAATFTAGPQPADRMSSNVASTTGFVAGAVVTLTQESAAHTAGVQPADRSASIVDTVDGFAQQSLVRMVQGGAPTTYRHVAALDAAAKRFVWDRPLDAAYDLTQPITFATMNASDRLIDSVAGATITWTRALDPRLVLANPIDLATGAAVASATLVDDAAQPTLTISAINEGTWGNHVSVRVARTSTFAARTRVVAQPADRLSSLVESVVGFAAGTVVRLFQDGLAAPVDAVIAAVDPGDARIVWTAPLPPALDLGKAANALDPHPIALESAEFTLSVYEDGQLREVFELLSLVRGNARYYAPNVINGASAFIAVADLGSPTAPPHDFPDPQSPSLDDDVAHLRGGRDGIAALTTRDFTGDLSIDARRGLRTLELIQDVSAIAAPDLLIERIPAVEILPPPVVKIDPCDPCAVAPPGVADPPPPELFEQSATFTRDQVFTVQQAIVDHCERMRDRIALLDPPNFAPMERSEIDSWRRRFDTSYAALYYPWILVVDPLRRVGDLVRAIPPSGHVLGIFARSDRAVGVHKAPANEELLWAQDLTIDVTPEFQGVLNPKGINALRPFAGRGLRVYGARTVSSEPAWRFLNVRRLFIMIERAIDKALQWSVFEPNDVHLREKISLTLSTFLTQLWRSGALAGATVEESFYIRCNDSNNPPELAAEGQMLAEVGIAPTIPAEFVVLRIGRVEDALQVTESPEVTTWQ